MRDGEGQMTAGTMGNGHQDSDSLRHLDTELITSGKLNEYGDGGEEDTKLTPKF